MFKVRYLVRDVIRSVVRVLTSILKFLFPQQLAIENLQIEIPYLESPLRLVQISDIHYDHTPIRIDDLFLSKVIDAVNKQNPDLIVITGDLVQCSPEPIDDLINKHLSRLEAKVGVYSILGNHDYKTTHGPETIINALKKNGIKVLHNETAYPMGRESGKLQLVGLGDYGKKRVNFKLNLVKEDLEEQNRARVVLSHNPDSAFDLEPYEIDLVLSGHTHGGQICFPNGTPVLPIFDKIFLKFPKTFLLGLSYPRKVVKNWTWCQGHHILKGVQFETPKHQRPMNLYINRGLATHPPMRLFCDPEITIIDLIPKKQQDQQGSSRAN